jgi:beta-catenin-like protein 1
MSYQSSNGAATAAAATVANSVGATASSSSSSFQDALDRMAMGGISSSSAASASASASASGAFGIDFIPARTWEGSKPGYYFGTNQQGTGYYRDSKQQPPHENGVDSTTSKKRKGRSVQIDEDRNEMVFVPSNTENKKQLSLLEQAEQQSSSLPSDKKKIVMELTAKGLRSATNALVKVVQQNALQRAQYAPQEPQQYMESELALYEHITSLSAIAANVHLYQHLVVTVPVVDREDNDNGASSSSSSSSSSSLLLSTLLQLLGEHDNADVCASIISLFLEWIDPALLSDDNNDDDEDCSVVLLPILAQLTNTILVQAWDTIVSNLGRFQRQQQEDRNGDEEEEDQTLKGIDNILLLMENILELDLIVPEGVMNMNNKNNNTKQSAAAFMVQETTIVSWLLEQLRDNDGDDDDSNELPGRCLELLAFLTQREDVHTVLPDWSELPPYQSAFSSSSRTVEQDDGGTDNKKRSKRIIQGMELLLQAIGRYRKKQPTSERQLEYLENAAMVLSSCLTYSPHNVTAFLQGQGIELVMRCLKERVHAGGCCLKLLDYFGSDVVHKSACEHVIVDASGLKYILPLFMGTRLPKAAVLSSESSSSKAKKDKREWIHLIETQTIRILYAMTRHLDDSSPQDAKARLVAKFVEDSDKCDRLVELLLSYDQKALKAEYLFYRSDVEDQVIDQDGGDTQEETVQLAALDAKLKGGGEVFHRLGAIAAFLCVHSKRCHERIVSQLQLQQSGLSVIKAALEEFISVLGSGEQKDQLQSYVDHL